MSAAGDLIMGSYEAHTRDNFANSYPDTVLDHLIYAEDRVIAGCRNLHLCLDRLEFDSAF